MHRMLMSTRRTVSSGWFCPRWNIRAPGSGGGGDGSVVKVALPGLVFYWQPAGTGGWQALLGPDIAGAGAGAGAGGDGGHGLSQPAYRDLDDDALLLLGCHGRYLLGVHRPPSAVRSRRACELSRPRLCRASPNPTREDASSNGRGSTSVLLDDQRRSPLAGATNLRVVAPAMERAENTDSAQPDRGGAPRTVLLRGSGGSAARLRSRDQPPTSSHPRLAP